MRCLVTGGAGFIGSELVRHLLGGGHDSIVYDNLSAGRRELLPEHPRVRFVQGDVRDRLRVERVVASARPDCVVHLAALHFIPYCDAHPAETIEVNVDGTQNLLRACATTGVECVVFASSAAVYAPSLEACNEAWTQLGPCDIYGESKLLGEGLVGEYYKQARKPTVALRIFNAIGPRETNPHVLPHVFESLRVGDEVRLGNTASRRDYVSTFDVARAVAAAIERARGLQVLNVGSGLAYSVAEIVDKLRRRLARPLRITVDSKRLRPVDRPTLVADIRSIHEHFGWLPEVSLARSLDDLIRYYDLSGSGPERVQSSSSCVSTPKLSSRR
jgi:UDP-glucose 4-epimerase